MQPAAAPTRRRAVASPVEAVTAVALVLLVSAAAAAGAAVTGATTPSPIADPGAAVRWGLPVARAVGDLGAALTLGALALTWGVLPSRPGPHGRRRVHLPALHLACAAAAGWALAGLARLVLGYAAATGQGLDAPDLGAQLTSFVTQVDAGRFAAAAVVLAALTATLAAGATGVTAARLLTVLAGAALVADVLAREVHGTGAGDVAVRVGLVVHAAGAAVWVGGLAALLLLARRLDGELGAVAVRFARPAVWAFAVVAVSGVVVGPLRLGAPAGLATGYGGLLVVKAAALVALGVLGVAHRRRVLPLVAGGSRRALLRAAVVEVGVAVTVIGLSAALAATDPPTRTDSRAVTLAAPAGHW